MIDDIDRILDQGDSDALALELARLTEIIRAGKRAEDERASIMRRAHHRDRQRWTQTWLAQQADISQQAVSKAMRAPGEKAVEEYTDAAYLIGRLLGVAQTAARTMPGRTASALERQTDKLIEEKTPITRETLRQFRHHLAARIGATDVGAAPLLRATVADIDAKLDGQDVPDPLPSDDKTRVRLLLGLDQQRAALTREMRLPKR